jgi:mono/diheme cytochrome c family protein
VLTAALSTGHKSGIAIVAAVYVVFALCSALLLPKLFPNFPGRRMGLFLGASAVLTVGMLVTIFTLAKEPPEAGAKVEEKRAAAHPGTTGTETAPPGAPAGNAAAGKTLFNAQGCAACHTLKAAGSTATVGPDLDDVAANAQTANRGPLDEYVAESITDPGAYVVPGFPNGVMPTTFSSLSAQQIADLVAFITGGKS